MTELRAATAESHARLDGKLGLLEAAVTQERYAAFLRGSLFALEPLEAALSPWATPLPSRSRLIRADLADLGASAQSAYVPGKLDIATRAQAFGARYVIEGSALGGAVLARAFQKALGSSAGSQRFLTLHGERLAEHWRAFLYELEAWDKIATSEMRSDACGTARAVFVFYEGAFEAAGAFSKPQ